MTTTEIQDDIDYGGRIELSMEDYEKLSTEEENVDYELVDYPINGITNEQMEFALTCSKLFPTGTTFVCSDSGTYTKGHTYQIKITDGQKSWEDLTDIGSNKLDKLPESAVNRVYIRDADGADTDKAFSYSAEGDTFAVRNTAGNMQTENPVADKDVTNKTYVDKLVGEYITVGDVSGTLTDGQYGLIVSNRRTIIVRSGVIYRLNSEPLNGSGDYTFISDYYYKTTDSTEWAAYIIVVKADKTWTWISKNFSGGSDSQSDDSAVLYTEQELTEEQQNQVCSNLDLESKFVQAQSANDGELKAYCQNGQKQDVCRISNDGLAGAVARYTATGQLTSRVDPTADTDLVRLNYIKNKLNHQQIYFGTTLPSSGIGTTYLENDVFILSNSNGTKNFYQLNYIDNSSSLSWHDMVDFEKPKWQVFAPSDLSQVLMTEVTIITSDEVNFTGMDGKKVTVNGYSGNGFTSGTVVCDEIDDDIKYSPAFIGSITSTRASGVFIKGSNSVTVVNVDNPEVTFSYKYLW